MSWNTAREKLKESSANNANLFPFLQGQEKQRNKKKEIEPINQLWLLFSNHSAVKREQIIFTLETMKRRQESGTGISFIDS